MLSCVTPHATIGLKSRRFTQLNHLFKGRWKTGSVDIADQYGILYSSVPSEPTCLSELLMRIQSSVRNICQHNDYCIQHCHCVNSSQISDVIERLRFSKSDGIENLYSDNFKHGTGNFPLYICCY